MRFKTFLIILFVFNSPVAFGAGRTELRSICHVKGQEENTLRGLGLVVGLNGTGESNDLQTMRALSSAMEIMGSPVSTTGRSDAKSLEELKKFKNVSLVMVTATVPATGARRGDKLDCFVMALNGKSLLGGRLAFASLQGPNTQDKRVYALCEGQLVVDSPDQPMVAHIHSGCQMQEDVKTPFIKDGYVTLIMDRNHADFNVTWATGTQIQELYRQFVTKEQEYLAEQGESAASAASLTEQELLDTFVEVVDASAIRVKVPQAYKDTPAGFVALLMELQLYDAEPEARVVINPRAETITISGDVSIGDVVVTHRNLTIEANQGVYAEFTQVNQNASSDAKLDQLLQALSELRVPAADIIEIIKGINRNGKLHGKLVVE